MAMPNTNNVFLSWLARTHRIISAPLVDGRTTQYAVIDMKVFFGIHILSNRALAIFSASLEGVYDVLDVIDELRLVRGNL